MAVTAKWYGNALAGQYSTISARRVDWETDTIKVALTTDGYSPDQDVHDFFSDVTDEISGVNYDAGGLTLTGKSVSYSPGTNETILDAADAEWPSASFTARRAVVYKSTGSASTSPLLGFIDFGGDVTVSSGTFLIDWTGGVLKVTAA